MKGLWDKPNSIEQITFSLAVNIFSKTVFTAMIFEPLDLASVFGSTFEQFEEKFSERCVSNWWFLGVPPLPSRAKYRFGKCCIVLVIKASGN